MSARIARGTAAARRPAARSEGKGKRGGKAAKKGLFEGLPISAATARRLALWGGASALLIIGAATAVAFKLPQRIGTAVGEQVGAAGFSVARVELRGLSRLDAATVTKAALEQPARAMPLVDLDAIRERLMRFSWVKDARVSRRLPDTLVVDIVERVPAAVWQHNRRLQLVDAEGVALEAVRPDALPNLPLVIGPGAQHRIAALGALIEAAPQLRAQVAGATWISGRRWDIRFKTGETLSLPEGEEPALTAIRKFADISQRRRLLGSNFLRFDMRLGDRMIVQLRNVPDQKAPAAATAPAPTPAPRPPRGQAPQDVARTI